MEDTVMATELHSGVQEVTTQDGPRRYVKVRFHLLSPTGAKGWGPWVVLPPSIATALASHLKLATEQAQTLVRPPDKLQ